MPDKTQISNKSAVKTLKAAELKDLLNKAGIFKTNVSSVNDAAVASAKAFIPLILSSKVAEHGEKGAVEAANDFSAKVGGKKYALGDTVNKSLVKSLHTYLTTPQVGEDGSFKNKFFLDLAKADIVLESVKESEDTLEDSGTAGKFSAVKITDFKKDFSLANQTFKTTTASTLNNISENIMKDGEESTDDTLVAAATAVSKALDKNYKVKNTDGSFTKKTDGLGLKKLFEDKLKELLDVLDPNNIDEDVIKTKAAAVAKIFADHGTDINNAIKLSGATRGELFGITNMKSLLTELTT